ncbi:hypothetical protein AB1Y20_001400 [Prymnesium parvum]|uniref:Phospholipase B-like n=1 Tax=Prymnesium parvum TaxID=97485 RepID=A0AB34KDA6_PRYPA
MLLLLSLLLPPSGALRLAPTARTDRRRLVTAGLAAATLPSPMSAEQHVIDLNLRRRDAMTYGSTALLPGDFYFLYNVVPPRKFSPANVVQQPQWNAFGSCVENSCTYVPISQRYAAYAKYSARLSYGLRSFQEIRQAIERADWEAVRRAVSRDVDGSNRPAPAVDALLKAGLLASQMLVSPNNLREKKEAALANFYVNEVTFALELLEKAAAEGDVTEAQLAWDFGKDSWNSYLTVVNRAIVPKVGEKFQQISP